MPSLRPLILTFALACTPTTCADERASSGRIVFLAEGPEGAAIEQILPSGQGTKTLLRGTPLHEGPSVFPGPVAPDGSHLVVITVEEQGGEHRERLELRALAPDGSLGAPLWRSEAASQVRNPSWAPGARFFAFEASFTSFRDIYRLDLSGDAPPTLTRLTDHPAGNYEPAISPDEREIAFVSSRDGNAEVYVMGIEGSAPRRLTVGPMDDWGPRWSPDGSQLAFLSNRERFDRIYLCKPDGSQLRRLTRDDASQPAEPGEAEPAFSPDGRSLVFSTQRGPNRAALHLVELSSGLVTPLTSGEYSDREPTWAPDGAWLVFTSDRQDADPELYLMRRDGSEVTRLTKRPGPDWLPRWASR